MIKRSAINPKNRRRGDTFDGYTTIKRNVPLYAHISNRRLFRLLFVPGWGGLLTATQCTVTNSPGWDGGGEGGGGGRTFGGWGESLRGEELATRHVPHSNAGSRFWAWTWPQECGSWERGRRAAASIDGAQVGVSSDYHKTARGCGSDPSFTAGTGGVSRAPHSLPGVGLSLSHTCMLQSLTCFRMQWWKKKMKGLQYLLREMLFGFIAPPLRRDAKLSECWGPVVMKYSWKLLKDAFVLFAFYTNYWL